MSDESGAVKLHDPVKPFDHKPEKRGSDGKLISARFYGTHIVSGSKYFYFYDEPHKFYDEGGQPIHIDSVPDVCKRNLKKIEVPKPKQDVIIKSSKVQLAKKSGESDPEGSLV